MQLSARTAFLGGAPSVPPHLTHTQTHDVVMGNTWGGEGRGRWSVSGAVSVSSFSHSLSLASLVHSDVHYILCMLVVLDSHEKRGGEEAGAFKPSYTPFIHSLSQHHHAAQRREIGQTHTHTHATPPAPPPRPPKNRQTPWAAVCVSHQRVHRFVVVGVGRRPTPP